VPLYALRRRIAQDHGSRALSSAGAVQRIGRGIADERRLEPDRGTIAHTAAALECVYQASLDGPAHLEPAGFLLDVHGDAATLPSWHLTSIPFVHCRSAELRHPALDQGCVDDFVNTTQPLRGLAPCVDDVANHNLLDLLAARRL
jgi:hypothetical protein